MAKRLPLAERVYDPHRDVTHYAGNPSSGFTTLCRFTDWTDPKQKGLPTDALVDCSGCIDIVRYVLRHKLDPLPEDANGQG